MGGAVSRVIRTVAGPVINTVKSFMGGLFGRARTTATNVAHRAIDTAKDAAVDAIRTGDIRGSAQSAWSKTKADAIRTAEAQFSMEKEKAKAAATAHLQQKHKEFVSKANAAGAQVGSGFGKAHFKKLERHAHSHINKVFTDAKRHAKKAVAKRRTKKEFNAHKKLASKTLQATHKGGVLKLSALLKDIRSKAATAKGKGGGVKVGAGLKGRKGKKGSGWLSNVERKVGLVEKKKGAGVRVPRNIIGRR